MISNPKYQIDGFTTLLGGVDETTAPLLLRPNQVARAINLTFRGGFLKPRPAYMKRGLTFNRGEYAQWISTHRYQGCEYYDDFRGMEKVVFSCGGRIFLIDVLNGYTVSDISPRLFTTTAANFTAQDPFTDIVISMTDAHDIHVGYPIYINGSEYTVTAVSGMSVTVRNQEEADGTVVAAGATVEIIDANSPNQPIAWFVQAEQYLIIQDDQSSAIIFDGSSTRRAAAAGEVPSGSCMAYGRGRIWVAINNSRQFVAGDIAGGPTGVLAFTENTYLAGGGSFRVGANVGQIRAMRFVMQLDTSLGQGPLQVFCDKAVYSVNAPTQRDLWAVVTNPIQTESLINFGASAQASTILINGDVFFRAEDGLRSFIVARRDFGMWGNTPISTEMATILDKDTQELLLFSSAVLFENRLLFTASPAPCSTGTVYHRALVALDFDLISTLQAKQPPAFDGIWTGIKVSGLVAGKFAGKGRCFAFAVGLGDTNEFWEITREGLRDNNINQIEWALETRSLLNEAGLKRLENAEAWVQKFIGESTLTIRYRPDQNPCWQDWDSKTICIVDDQCDSTNACTATTNSNMAGYKTRLGFDKPDDENNSADEKAMRFAFSYQVRIEGRGWISLNLFRIQANVREEYPFAPPSDDRSECSSIACCPPNPFGYAATCGALDGPIVQYYSVDNGSMQEYFVRIYLIEGLHYEVWHSNAVLKSRVHHFDATSTGYLDLGMTRIENIGANEKVWYVITSSGDCPERTSPITEIPIVY